jgi:hypothetical protein
MRAGAAQRGKGRRSRDAINRESCPSLEPAYRPCRGKTKDAVDRPCGHPPPSEEKLQSGHVPAAPTLADQARAESRPATAPKRTPGLRTGNAVDNQMLSALEATDRPRGLHAGDPINTEPVEAGGPEGDLESSDVRAAGDRHVCRDQHEQHPSQSDETCPAAGVEHRLHAAANLH